MGMEKVGVALLGFGIWGRNLARNLHELGALRLICDPSPERLEEAGVHYPDVDRSGDPEAALERDDIQGVAIAAPAVTHYELALRALQAGKDVFVEKPLALSVKEGQRLVEEAERRQRVLMVGHVLEYHPAVQTLRELIARGELGRLRYLYSNRLNWGRIRTEENILWSFAPHDIALMLRLLGTMPEEVACHGEAYLNHDVADVTLTVLKFPRGIQAHIFVSWLHPFKEQRFVVVGERQIAVFDDTQPWERKLVLYPHRVEWEGGQIPIARKAEGIPVSLEPKEPLRAEMEHFLHCISTRQRPLTDGESALRVLEVLMAAQQSLDDGGRAIVIAPGAKEGIYVHPTAVVDEGAEIGEGTKIWHFSHVMPGAKIGRDCVLGQNVFVGRNVVIGDRCKIQNNVSVYEGVTLEEGVFCGPSMVFTNVINPRSEIERKDEFRPTLVKRGATLGANSTILCGVTIGRYAFVGAGAVVTKDVPDYALVVGVPARIVGWMCECGVKLKFVDGRAVCLACGKRYRKEGDRVVPEVSS
ncbi:Gfo/Idh/MocA family oxidoreductase [Thermoflexus sp.]|uniref:Gfo/Idh/MocA family oxidoreductase n=1 Tax=Thermoflexus sp. TaxID=1969742 RepID=UPI0035E45B86